jgi:hypothetical protein
LINHWTAVKDFLKSSLSFFAGIGSAIFHALINPFIELPGAIRSAWGGIRTEVEGIAGKIGRFFVGHSPIPEGPLHNLNLGREIGRSLQPTPVLNAVRAAAAAVALAVPTIAPTIGPGKAFAGSDGGSIVIHSSPTIIVKGEGGDADLEAKITAILKKHDDELLKKIEMLKARQARLVY